MRPVASAIFGDFNLSADEVKALADEIGGTFARGHGPDHGIVIGAEVADVNVLGKNGSDAHHAILFILEVGGQRVRVLLWNVWVGQSPRKVRRALRRLIRQHKPDVVVLNEAYRCGEVLRKIKRFEVHQGPNVREGADVAVLVADPHYSTHSRRIRMQKSWTVVSKGRLKFGREYRAVRTRLDGGPALRVLGIHFPTDNWVNAEAVEESKERVVQWATRRKKAHR